MKITFDDTINKTDWLHRCLLGSLSTEAIDSGRLDRSYEVKLLVNGIELEPTLLNDLISNIEKYVDREALSLYERKFAEQVELMREKTNQLTDMIDEAQYKIKEQFNITED